MKEKNEREYSATCMACGWAKGGGHRKGQTRRAGAKKGGGGGAKKGRMLSAGPKEWMRRARRSESVVLITLVQLPVY